MSAPDWRAVARKDFEDAVRSKMLWSVMGVFVAFMAVLVVLVQATAPDAVDSGATAVLAFVAQLAQLFVPLTALIAGYMAVVGERTDGSLRILLSYPFSRFDVVFGKLVGRSAVIATTLVVAFVFALGLATLMYGGAALGPFLGLVVAALLFGGAWTGVAVGISAGSTTRGRAMALAIGLYLVMFMFWQAIAAGVYSLVEGSIPGLVVEPWYFLLERLNPIEAFRVLAESALGEPVRSMVMLPVEDVPLDASPEQLALANRVAGDLPFYLDDWFAAVLLVAWAVVPALVGYRRFRRSDLE